MENVYITKVILEEVRNLTYAEIRKILLLPVKMEVEKQPF